MVFWDLETKKDSWALINLKRLRPLHNLKQKDLRPQLRPNTPFLSQKQRHLGFLFVFWSSLVGLFWCFSFYVPVILIEITVPSISIQAKDSLIDICTEEQLSGISLIWFIAIR